MKISKLKITIKYLIVIACLAVLASCLAPEKFKSTINIEKDGAYSVKFEGILVHPMIRMAILQGQPEQMAQRAIKQGESKFTPEAGCQRFKYLGQGRFDVLFEKTGKATDPFYFTERKNQIISIQQKGNLILLQK